MINRNERIKLKEKNVEGMTKKFYTTPKIENIGRMIVYTNGAVSRTNDPGGNTGGTPPKR